MVNNLYFAFIFLIYSYIITDKTLIFIPFINSLLILNSINYFIILYSYYIGNPCELILPSLPNIDINIQKNRDIITMPYLMLFMIIILPFHTINLFSLLKSPTKIINFRGGKSIIIGVLNF